jgi:hypothetical protein
VYPFPPLFISFLLFGGAYTRAADDVWDGHMVSAVFSQFAVAKHRRSPKKGGKHFTPNINFAAHHFIFMDISGSSPLLVE